MGWLRLSSPIERYLYAIVVCGISSIGSHLRKWDIFIFTFMSLVLAAIYFSYLSKIPTLTLKWVRVRGPIVLKVQKLIAGMPTVSIKFSVTPTI